MRRTLLLLAVPLLAACGGSSQPASAPPPQTQVAAQPSEGPLGSAAHDGDLTITLRTVKLAARGDYPGGIPDPDYPQYGGFVVADVLEQNNGATLVSPGGFQVASADGQRYSQTVEEAFEPQIIPTGQGPLQPGGKIRGNVVFDTPVKHGTITYTTDSTNIPVYSWAF